MNQGWIKLHRKSLKKGWLRNHVLWALWTYLLLKASHREHTVIIGNQEIHLKPGQLVFGRRKAAKDLGIGEQQTRTRLGFLKTAGNLTIKTTNKFSIITIVNWDTYQGEDQENNQQNNQRVTTKQPHTRMVKNGKNKDICPFEDIRAIYNSTLGDALRAACTITDTRKRALNARWSEKHETSDGEVRSDSLEYWDRYFKHVKSSSFLTGGSRDGWKANFDWLIKKSNFIKVIENTYHKQ
jgi:hypothetical protein